MFFMASHPFAPAGEADVMAGFGPVLPQPQQGTPRSGSFGGDQINGGLYLGGGQDAKSPCSNCYGLSPTTTFPASFVLQRLEELEGRLNDRFDNVTETLRCLQQLRERDVETFERTGRTATSVRQVAFTASEQTEEMISPLSGDCDSPRSMARTMTLKSVQSMDSVLTAGSSAMAGTPSHRTLVGRGAMVAFSPGSPVKEDVDGEDLPGKRVPVLGIDRGFIFGGGIVKESGRSEGREVEQGDDLWIDGEPCYCRGYRVFSNFVRSTLFDYIMGSCILLNAVFIGIQMDYMARYRLNTESEQEPALVSMIETVFAGVFLLELIARLITYHVYFCTTAWNLFDALLVLSATMEECVKYGVGGDTIAGKLSVFRVVRVAKLLRTLRVIRVLRMFQELRVVLLSMLHSARQLFWTSCLLLICIYMVSLVILAELTNSSTAWDSSSEGTDRRKYFADLPKTIYTLFQCATFGIQWERMSSLLEQDAPYMALIWTLYAGFVFFAFTNTVTGIFVHQATVSVHDDHRNVNLEEREYQDAAIATLRSKLRTVCQGLDHMSKKHLIKVCTERDTLKVFAKFGVDIRDVATFFDLVADTLGKVELAHLDDFLKNMFRLRGITQNVDLMALKFEQGKLAKAHREEAKDRVEDTKRTQRLLVKDMTP
eukprot:TRINITY_DN5429_c0_g2_i1.p1 TRINITY_DN5429_c0_g2~~TRINITY_DN5429_c0_g2_i1.p1  ORF type:complete len:656 (-),score=134.60 TRINITY_DN5429_c0_g2_i1:308-2275(-)